jgi:hypothetical protein
MFHLRPRKNNLTENNGCKDNRQELTAMRKLIERLDLEGRLRRENMHRYFLQCTLACTGIFFSAPWPGWSC